MRTPSAKTKHAVNLKAVISATKKLWQQHHLSYDQCRYVSKEVRQALHLERPKIRKRVVARLSRDEERRLIAHAYRMKSVRGLLIKTLFQTGVRVSEFVNIKVADFFFDEEMILISKAKGGRAGMCRSCRNWPTNSEPTLATAAAAICLRPSTPHPTRHEGFSRS